MTEIFASLPAHARVLDLGARHGSFDTKRNDVVVVLVDLEPRPRRESMPFVQADAARLPFVNDAFELIIANHSLEHFQELSSALAEVGRVARRDALFCVAVPDATTLADRIYRWLYQGGGHVNAFTSPRALAKLIEDTTGLAHIGTKPLCSSLAFLNRRNLPRPRLRRMLLFLGGSERLLVVLNCACRLLDRIFGTRLSLYGWCSFFGHSRASLLIEAWPNVCVRCGAGHPEAALRPRAQRRLLFIPVYSCPGCGAMNALTPETWFRGFHAGWQWTGATSSGPVTPAHASGDPERPR